MIAFKLAKAGYWAGDPEKVLSARVDIVLDALAFETFQSDYESVEWELNKNE